MKTNVNYATRNNRVQGWPHCYFRASLSMIDSHELEYSIFFVFNSDKACVRPCQHVSGYFWKHIIIYPFSEKSTSTQWAFSKKISVHTDTEESLIESFCSLNWLCKTKTMTSSFLKRYVFAVHTITWKRSFQKYPPRKLRLRVDGRPKRINKYAFSKISVYVWTGP